MSNINLLKMEIKRLEEEALLLRTQDKNLSDEVALLKANNNELRISLNEAKQDYHRMLKERNMLIARIESIQKNNVSRKNN